MPPCIMSCRNFFGTAFLSQLSIRGDHDHLGGPKSVVNRNSLGVAVGSLAKQNWLRKGDDADKAGLDRGI